MSRHSTLAWVATIGLASQAFAAVPTSASVTRKALVDCMSKRMAASRTISYNEAARLCKDRPLPLNANNAKLGVAGLPASSNPGTARLR